MLSVRSVLPLCDFGSHQSSRAMRSIWFLFLWAFPGGCVSWQALWTPGISTALTDVQILGITQPSPVVCLFNQHPTWRGIPVPLEVWQVLLCGSIFSRFSSTTLRTHPLPITGTEATRSETLRCLSRLSLTSCIHRVIKSHWLSPLSPQNLYTMHRLTYPFLLCPPKPMSYHFISIALFLILVFWFTLWCRSVSPKHHFIPFFILSFFIPKYIAVGLCCQPYHGPWPSRPVILDSLY